MQMYNKPTQHPTLRAVRAFAAIAAGAFVCHAYAANITVSNAADIKSKIEGAKNGDVITIQSNTYDMSGKAPIKLKANNVSIVAWGVTLDFKASKTTGKRGMEIHGDSNYIRGLRIIKSPDNGIHISGDSNTVERCTFENCFDTGLQISSGSGGDAPKSNKIVNCDSYNNQDTNEKGGNADGFAAKLGTGEGNRFSGCRALGNSDDGWDLFVKSGDAGAPVTLEYCIAATSGKNKGNGNGFKLGSDASAGYNHTLKNCIAFKNKSKGFDQNHNKGKVNISNGTASENSGNNFAFSEFTNGGTFTKNVSAGKWDVKGTQSGNLTDVKTDAFQSNKLEDVTRDGNGNLKFNKFMKYSNTGSAGANP